MTIKLSFGRDVQGFNAYAPSPSDILYSCALPSGDDDSITVPGYAENWVIAFAYQPGAIFWVAYNDSAEVPVGSTFASTTSELNPPSRTVNAGDVINIINGAAVTNVIGIALYAK